MKIVVAPDSFKGSIDAKNICFQVKNAILRVFPSANILEIPLADGGEGTMENMIYSSNGQMLEVEVKGPIGKVIKAKYGIMKDNETVVIEMAQASGLPLLQEKERDPRKATSYGTGQLIKHALDNGYRKFIIGLGGSATNDGGAGMLRALGVQFFKKDGSELEEGGSALTELSYFNDNNLDARLEECSITIASDVTNKLCGDNGASAIFGPQKGATPEVVKELDGALNHFANIVLQQKGIDMRELVGGGAAGGLGASLITFMQAEIRSGIDVVMEQLNFESQIKDAHLVITGEGRLDSQTLSGKVISGVSNVARKYNVPVIALCGGMNLDVCKYDELGIVSAFSIVPGPCQLDEAMENADKWIFERTENIMRLMKIIGKSGDHDET